MAFWDWRTFSLGLGGDFYPVCCFTRWFWIRLKYQTADSETKCRKGIFIQTWISFCFSVKLDSAKNTRFGLSVRQWFIRRIYIVRMDEYGGGVLMRCFVIAVSLSVMRLSRFIKTYILEGNSALIWFLQCYWPIKEWN